MPYLKLTTIAGLFLGLWHLPIYWTVALASLESELAECAAIADDTRRLQCYDTLAGEAEVEAAPTKLKIIDAETDGAVAKEESAVERRIKQQEKTRRNWFAITPYRTNYGLPLTYNSTSSKDFAKALGAGDSVDKAEAKFQLSLQFDIWRDLLGKEIDLYFAYTQLAFWQLYNADASSPFRETNYEPEVGFIFRPGFDILGFNNRQIRFGFVHHSNGRGEPQSRSWNRLFAMFSFDRGNFSTTFRPWYRIPEDEEDDDNPDIEDFLGYFEWHSVYKWRQHTFGLMLRNNLKTGANHGAVQFDWSYPLTDRLKLYLQYFNGYGESLIDYNHSTNRIGVGLMLTDWL